MWRQPLFQQSFVSNQCDDYSSVWSLQIMEFNLKQKKRMEVVKRRDQERLANLRGIMEEQARRDRKR